MSSESSASVTAAKHTAEARASASRMGQEPLPEMHRKSTVLERTGLSRHSPVFTIALQILSRWDDVVPNAKTQSLDGLTLVLPTTGCRLARKAGCARSATPRLRGGRTAQRGTVSQELRRADSLAGRLWDR
jgi:hypothetical protein